MEWQPDASKSILATKTIAPKSSAAAKRPCPARAGSSGKVPHSAVEKKYRSNLNSKLIELQQCVPSLKAETEIKQEFGNLDTTRRRNKRDVKLQKGLILSSAAEYIRELQGRNFDLERDNKLLKGKLAVLQKIAPEKERAVKPDALLAERQHDQR